MMDSLKQSLRMAVKSINGSKLRAFLTMLGIIIGVMALVILVSLVNGATRTVTDTVSSLGTNLLTVTVSDDKGSAISLDDLSEWADLEGVGQTAAWQSESAVGKYGYTAETVQVYGTTAAYYNIQGLNMLLGRYIKSADVENGSNICAINENGARELVGYTDCIGESISLNGIRFTIVGILEDDDDSLTAVFGSSSLAVYIPYTALIRLSDSVSSKISSFYVSAADGYTVEQAMDAIYPILYERFDQDEDAFSVDSQDALENTMSSVTSVLAILLGGIAAISLIVG
ncbi:MAG: ABC transporter permease, partial [Phoenicibacter congonensis]|nr:ABC transporter permease [Phoenicibacter congonensis]